MSFFIGKKKIGNNEEPYFIADIAANHDGNIERAFMLIEMAKEAGADCAKFQNFKAKKIVSKGGFEKIGNLSHQASWQKSVYDTYEEASIADEWSERLKEKCDQVGIEYMTSPYDIESVDLANKYVNAFKIGSGDITWLEIIEHIAKKEKPVILATGASTMGDVQRAMTLLTKYNKDVVIMQCNTNYTASDSNFKHINLNVLRAYSLAFPDAILGLSDHTIGHTTVLGAYALGARVFEKHFTDDNGRKGPDHKFSMNPISWKEMMKAVKELRLAMGDGVKVVEKNEEDTVRVQRRALYLQRNVRAGEIIRKDDLFPVRPACEGAVLPYEILEAVGHKANKDLFIDDVLRWEDLK